MLESTRDNSFVIGFVTGQRLRSEFYAGGRDETANLALLRSLEAQRSAIERDFGAGLSWEDLPGRFACRIATYRDGDVMSAAHYDEYIEWFVTTAARLRAAIAPHL